MIVLEVEGSFLLTQFVQGVSGDVMDVDELATGLSCHLTTPRAVGLVTAFDIKLSSLLVDGIDETTRMSVAFVPLVARGEGEQDGVGTLLLGIANHLLEIPSIGVDDFVEV